MRMYFILALYALCDTCLSEWNSNISIWDANDMDWNITSIWDMALD